MSLARIDGKLKIVSVEAKDLRWPTSLGGHGSDAMVQHFNNSFVKWRKSNQHLSISAHRSRLFMYIRHYQNERFG